MGLQVSLCPTVRTKLADFFSISRCRRGKTTLQAVARHVNLPDQRLRRQEIPVPIRFNR